MHNQKNSLNTLKTLSLITIAGLVTLVSQSTLAQDNGWYAGVNLGAAEAGFSENIPFLGQVGTFRPGTPEDESDLASKILIGYNLNRYFAIEASYVDLGSYDFSTQLPAASLPPSGAVVSGSAEVDGLALDLVGTLPLSESFSVFGRLGVSSLSSKHTFVRAGVPVITPGRDEHDEEVSYGIGLQYNFSDRFSFRGEFQRYVIEENLVIDDEIDTMTLGVVYRFGAR